LQNFDIIGVVLPSFDIGESKSLNSELIVHVIVYPAAHAGFDKRHSPPAIPLTVPNVRCNFQFI
jgi:hypothetical protein